MNVVIQKYNYELTIFLIHNVGRRTSAISMPKFEVVMLRVYKELILPPRQSAVMYYVFHWSQFHWNVPYYCQISAKVEAAIS